MSWCPSKDKIFVCKQNAGQKKKKGLLKTLNLTAAGALTSTPLSAGLFKLQRK